MNTQGEKCVDSHAERSRCLFRLRRRQEPWSQAGNGLPTQIGKQAGESKLGLKAITGSQKLVWKRLSRVKTNNTSQRHKELTELKRELMRPGEKRTQVKSMNKNLRQSYVPEHKETGLCSRTQEKEHTVD